MGSKFNDTRLPERFWDKATPEPNTGCWLWTASTSQDGYGFYAHEHGVNRGAHRVAYEVLRGLVPSGMQLDHKCRMRCCVNPDHLEPVTQAENIRRGRGGWHHRAKTRCPQGHEYSGDNLYIVRRANGSTERSCRTCRNTRRRRVKG